MDRTDLSVKAEIALLYDIYVPDAAGGPLPLLIAVHGYGAHKRYMMREAKIVADERFVIASVEAPHPHYRQTDDGYRIGYGWLCDKRPEQDIALHHKFILDVMAQLDRERLIDESKVFLYGFSQACALNLRFAFTHGEVLAGVIGVCGGIPGDLDTNENYRPFDAAMLYLYGDDDEFYSPEQFASYDERLRAILPRYGSKQYHAGHALTDEMRSDIKAFLAAEG